MRDTSTRRVCHAESTARSKSVRVRGSTISPFSSSRASKSSSTMTLSRPASSCSSWSIFSSTGTVLLAHRRSSARPAPPPTIRAQSSNSLSRVKAWSRALWYTIPATSLRSSVCGHRPVSRPAITTLTIALLPIPSRPTTVITRDRESARSSPSRRCSACRPKISVSEGSGRVPRMTVGLGASLDCAVSAVKIAPSSDRMYSTGTAHCQPAGSRSYSSRRPRDIAWSTLAPFAIAV